MKALKERKKPGRRPMSPTSKKAARRAAQVKYQEKMKSLKLRKGDESRCQRPNTKLTNRDDPNLMKRMRFKNKTFGEWRSLRKQLGLETDDLMASFLLNVYWAYTQAGFSADSSRILNKITHEEKKSGASGRRCRDKTKKATPEVRKLPEELEFNPVKKENITDGWTEDGEVPEIPQDSRSQGETDPYMVHNREDWTENSCKKEDCEESESAGEYSGCHTDILKKEDAGDNGSQETKLPKEAGYETFYIKEEPVDCDYGKDCDSGGNQSSGQSFQCLDCNITFSLEYDFTEHMNTHSSSKTFQCTICQVRFVNHDDFQKHMKIHADQILYKCSF